MTIKLKLFFLAAVKHNVFKKWFDHMITMIYTTTPYIQNNVFENKPVLILHPVFAKHSTISQNIMQYENIKLFCNYTTQRTILSRTSLYLETPTRQNIVFQILCIFLSALYTMTCCVLCLPCIV